LGRLPCHESELEQRSPVWFIRKHIITKGFSQGKRLMDKVDIEYINWKDGIKKIALKEYLET
jgi:hypothetical protein